MDRRQAIDGPLKVAFVGLGRRGMATLRRHLILDGVEIAVLCDCSADALAEAAEACRGRHPAPATFRRWEEMLDAAPPVSLVYISTDWDSHALIAVAAMKAGYDVAAEVPAATSQQQARELVETVRSTGRFFTMVENCCYDPFHLHTEAVAADGLLGRLTHCEGAYIHDLRSELAAGQWQAAAVAANHANPYPTHGLGPMCRLLGIGSTGSDAMAEVVSMSPKGQAGLNSCLISTRAGRTMLLQYDVVTPRPYSRLQTVCGTAGYMSKYPLPMAMFDGMSEPLTHGALDDFLALHRHPLLDRYEADGLRLRVPNMMNYIMDRRLVDLVSGGLEPDITVTDAVSWSSLAWLSRQSLLLGNRPVEIPQWD